MPVRGRTLRRAYETISKDIGGSGADRGDDRRGHRDRPGAGVYGDNVFEKDGIRRDRTGDGEKTRCLCGKRGIFNRDGPAMGPQIIRQLE